MITVLCAVLLLTPGAVAAMDHFPLNFFLMAYTICVAALVIGLDYHNKAKRIKTAENALKKREELITSLSKHREERSALQERSDSIKERIEQEVSAFIRT